jgi:hypothetical protein
MITIASRAGLVPLMSASLAMLAGTATAADGFYGNGRAGTVEAADDRTGDAYQPGGPVSLNDWRFGYGLLPNRAKISILTKDGSFDPNIYDKETNWDKTGRTGLTWMTPWSDLSEDGGFLLAFELMTNHYVIESSDTNPEISYRSVALAVHPGLGWELGDQTHLEISPFAGLGFSTLNVGTGHGLYFEFGLRAGVFYTCANRWQFGLNAAYMYAHSKEDFTANDKKFEATISSSGPAAAISIGYRFR